MNCIRCRHLTANDRFFTSRALPDDQPWICELRNKSEKVISVSVSNNMYAFIFAKCETLGISEGDYLRHLVLLDTNAFNEFNDRRQR